MDIINLIFEYLSKHQNLTFSQAVNLLNEKYHLIYNRLLELLKQHCMKIPDIVLANIGISSIENNTVAFANIEIKNEIINIIPTYHITDDDNTFCFMCVGLGNLGKYYSNLFKNHNVFSLINLKSLFYQTLKNNVKNDFTINDRFCYEILVRNDIYDERKDRIKS